MLPLVTAVASAEKPRLVLNPAGHTGLVREAIFTHDEKYLITCSEDKIINIRHMKSGDIVTTLRGYRGDSYRGVYYAIAVDPKDRYLAAGGWFKGTNIGEPGLGALRIFDLKKGTMIKLLKGHTSVILSLAFSPDGRFIASGSNDKTMRIWDTRGFHCIDTIRFHTNDIYGLSFSSDSRYCASSSNDGSMAVYDTEQKKLIMTKKKAHTGPVMSIRFSPDSRYIATGSHDGTVRLWAADTLAPVRKVHHAKKFYMQEVCFSPDSRLLLFGGNFREQVKGENIFPVYVYSIEKKKINHVIRRNDQTIQSIHFSRSGRYLALAGGSRNEVHILNAKDFSLYKTIAGWGSSIFSLAMGSDGKTIYWGEANDRGGNNNRALSRSISLEDFTVKEKIKKTRYRRVYNNIKGTKLEYTWRQFNKTIRVGKFSVTLPNRYDTIHAFSLTPDGKTALVGSDFGLYKIDCATGTITGEFTGHTGSILCLTVTGDSRYLISGSSDQTMKIWDIENFKNKTRFHPYKSLQDSWRRFARDKYPGIDLRSPGGVKELYTRMLKDYPKYRKYALSLVKKLPSTEPVATIFVDENGKYLVWTPDYYYTGDKGLFKYIGWHINRGEERDAKFYPFEQFDLKYNRPDIILKRLGKTDRSIIDYFHAVYKKRIKKMGFREKDLSGELHAPEVTIAGGRNGYTRRITTRKAAATIAITAKDTKYTLDRINIYNNRVPLYGRGGIPVKKLHTKQINKSLKVKLVPGINRIMVSAINEKGVESLKESITLNCKKKFSAPTVYIATIGVSRYKNTLPPSISAVEFEKDLLPSLREKREKDLLKNCYRKDTKRRLYHLSPRISGKIYAEAAKILAPLDYTYNLNYAHKDALDLIGIYKKSKTFKKVKVLNVNDEKAVRFNIERINAFFKQSAVNDVAILFIAGHGLRDKKLNYYFGTHDIDFKNPAARGYPFRDLDSLFDRIPSLNRLFFMDTCHSGELPETFSGTMPRNGDKGTRGRVKARSFPAQRTGAAKNKKSINSRLLKRSLYANLRYGTGAVVITSSGSMELSYEGVDNRGKEVSNGVFTYSLISGLKNYSSDKNGDRKIQVSEIMKWIHDNVKALTKGRQTPSLRREFFQRDNTVY